MFVLLHLEIVLGLGLKSMIVSASRCHVHSLNCMPNAALMGKECQSLWFIPRLCAGLRDYASVSCGHVCQTLETLLRKSVIGVHYITGAFKNQRLLE